MANFFIMEVQCRAQIDLIWQRVPERVLNRSRCCSKSAAKTFCGLRDGTGRQMFGFSARWFAGELTESSDIDFLVDAGDRTSPWFPAGLVDELETLLGRPVDVVTEDALHWLLRRRILKEARPL